MASRRAWRRQPRTRPERGAVRAVLDGYAALAGSHEGPGVPGVAARLWAAATCADATPARVYLSRRGCWPGHHVPGAPPLPDSVRWLAREDAPAPNPAAGWPGLPPGASGAVVLAWWPARRVLEPRSRRSEPRCARRARLPRGGRSIDGRDVRRCRLPGRRPGRRGCGDGRGGCGRPGASGDGRLARDTLARSSTGRHDMSRTRHEAVPESQHERNEAFHAAVRAGRSDVAAALARADPPADATDAERERWRIRRRLYRRVNGEGET